MNLIGRWWVSHEPKTFLNIKALFLIKTLCDQRREHVALSCVITKMEITQYAMARDLDKWGCVYRLLSAALQYSVRSVQESQAARQEVTAFITVCQLDSSIPRAVSFPFERRQSHLCAIKSAETEHTDLPATIEACAHSWQIYPVSSCRK